MMKKAFENRFRIMNNINNFLINLMFSGDSAIFTNTDAGVTNIIYHTINLDKTKVATTDEALMNIHLDGIQIEQIQEFK